MGQGKDKNSITPPRIIVPNNWYRSVAAKSIALNILLGLAVVVMAFDKLNAPPIQTKYFAVSNDGRVTDLIPLNKAHENQSKIAQWLTDAVTETYAWNFTNYKEVTDTVCKKYFTQNGCNGYKESLKEEILTYVTNNRLLVSAVVVDTPLMVREGLTEQGIYYWTFQLPLRVTYESSDARKSQKQILTVTILRESLANKPRGLGIEDIVYERLEG
ncbi:MAG: DotI/IcmL family type IV secretion protein [Gammaproteobacteria bacterium]|nr:DotI/IcmL family type IV secretion protein [Gammaproteobacteria bacterium]